jgi:hypothetical protein
LILELDQQFGNILRRDEVETSLTVACVRDVEFDVLSLGTLPFLALGFRGNRLGGVVLLRGIAGPGLSETWLIMDVRYGRAKRDGMKPSVVFPCLGSVD